VVEGAADIGVSAQALSTADVAKVTVTVSAPDLSSSIVSDLRNTGGQWKGVIGAIPAGANRSFLAQAFNSSNTKIYEGQATGVTITQGSTAAVVILLQQSTPPTPFVNSAPKLTGLTASLTQVEVNQPVTLSVTATDADGDPRSYAWTATGGTFTNETTASPTWTAPATEGLYTLSVSVSDGRGGQAGISLKISVVRAKAAANVAVSFNAWPVASQVTGTPSGQVATGGVVNLDVMVVEPDNDPLTYSWADDCGGTFSGLTVKSPVWTAPAAAPANAVCKVTVTLSDGRGGSTTGQLGINVGLPPVATAPPVIDQTFQSTDTIAAGGTVDLSVSAHDPENEALTFTWSASAGTLGTAVTTASRSEVTWTSPTLGVSETVTLVVQDASGQRTTQSFTLTITGGTLTCVKTVTSYLKKANPYGSPLTVTYSMVGGGGGGGGVTAGGSGVRATGSFTLGTGNLEVFVGGGGGQGVQGAEGYGAGGAGYYGGGGSGSGNGFGGGGGGGGSSAILHANQLVAVAAGGNSFGRGGSMTGGAAGDDLSGAAKPTAGTFGAGGRTSHALGGTGLNGGTAVSPSVGGGGGGGYGGGGGGWGVAGGSAGASPSSGGLGANTWSTATALPAAAGAGTTAGGNAGLVILTYNALSCQL
jgi:hypothetical protein